MKILNRAVFLFGILGFASLTSPAVAQSSDQQKYEDDTPTSAFTELGAELRRLQGKVAELEAALAAQHRAKYGEDSSSGRSTMKSMKKMSGMGKGKMSGMKSMQGDGKSGGMKIGMGMMKGLKRDAMGKGGMSEMKSDGMGMMGRMKGMGMKDTGQMKMASSLPGFPGASHIYHVGATGFFLNHSEHITLTPDQQSQLNRIKEAALLAQGTFDRRIEETEQQLWVLTSADSPDATEIESRIGEIAKLSSGKRIAFIRAVGKAAKVLTAAQKQTLIGLLPPNHLAAGAESNSNEITE